MRSSSILSFSWSYPCLRISSSFFFLARLASISAACLNKSLIVSYLNSSILSVLFTICFANDFFRLSTVTLCFLSSYSLFKRACLLLRDFSSTSELVCFYCGLSIDLAAFKPISFKVLFISLCYSKAVDSIDLIDFACQAKYNFHPLEDL